MNKKTKTEAMAQKDVQKLQRAVVDGLEDIKAADIQIFNTEALTPLFERVVVASGNSNRQTKALAASVRDKVREAGFDKPRTEGEENGEWIIVDCGAVVAHIMQPAIRQYYRLEEIWGDKPVHVRTARAATRKAAPGKKPVAAPARQQPEVPAKALAAKKTSAVKKAAPTAPAKPVAKTPSASKAAAKKVVPKKVVAKKTAAASKGKAVQKSMAATKTAATKKTPARKKTTGAAARKTGTR